MNDGLPQDTAQECLSLDDLERLSGVARRTIRYYIQLGLVSRPLGETRAAHYTWEHLADLLAIRRLTGQGLALDAVRRRLRGGTDASDEPQEPGALRVATHIRLAPGVELVVDSDRSGLGAESLRRLARDLVQWLARERQEGVNDEFP